MKAYAFIAVLSEIIIKIGNNVIFSQSTRII